MIGKMSILMMLLTLSPVVKADLPVHCITYEEPSTAKFEGIWHFHVSKDVAEVNLFKVKEVCTH